MRIAKNISNKFIREFRRDIESSNLERNACAWIERQTASVQHYFNHLETVSKPRWCFKGWSEKVRFVPATDRYITEDLWLRNISNINCKKIDNTWDTSASSPVSNHTSEVIVTSRISCITDTEKKAVFVGGPSALWGAFWASRSGASTVFINSSLFDKAAAVSSSGQFHEVHADQMYTDPSWSACSILLYSLRRSIFGFDVWRRYDRTIAQVDFCSLKKIETWKVALGYAYNSFKSRILRKLNYITDADNGLLLAVLSGYLMEYASAMLNVPLFKRTGTLRIANPHETSKFARIQKWMYRYGRDCNKINLAVFVNRSGTCPNMYKDCEFWQIPNDGVVFSATYKYLMKAIENVGGIVVNGKLEKIHYDSNSSRVTAISFDTGQIRKTIAVSYLYTSLGANCLYTTDGSVHTYKGLPAQAVAVGASLNVLIELATNESISAALQVPLDINHVHITPKGSVFCDKHTGRRFFPCRVTGGGTVTIQGPNGAGYNSNDAKTMISILDGIFSSRKIHIISAQTCWRPIASSNSGLVESLTWDKNNHGVGIDHSGSGVTKAAAVGFFVNSCGIPNLLNVHRLVYDHIKHDYQHIMRYFANKYKKITDILNTKFS